MRREDLDEKNNESLPPKAEMQPNHSTKNLVNGLQKKEKEDTVQFQIIHPHVEEKKTRLKG